MGGGVQNTLFSLKIKQSLHVHFCSSCFTTFCVMAIKTQFMVINYSSRFTGNNHGKSQLTAA